MPTSYSTFQPPNSNYPSKNLSMSVVTPSFPHSPPPQPFKPNFIPVVQPRELPRQRLPESFNLVTPLPVAFSLRTDSSVSLCRARMENRNVVLRVLNGGFFIAIICRPFSPDFQDMVSVVFPFSLSTPSHSCLLQTLLMPQKGTTSWALHPSCPSWDHIPSCQSFLVLSHSGLPWLQLWKNWRIEICSASCGVADRYIFCIRAILLQCALTHFKYQTIYI